MIFSKSHLWALLFACTFVLISCEKGDEQPSELYQTGVFIINKGASSGGTGSVSYYDRDADILKNDIFATANNGTTMGDALQSMSLFNGLGYLIANNANKMLVVNPQTFALESTLSTGLTKPRYVFHGNTTSAYISQWGTDSATSGIAVYDYSTKTIAKIIPTGKGPDRIIRSANTSAIIVLNTGGLEKDSTIAYINSAADTLVQKLVVGLAPNSVVEDANGDIWVVCGGEPQKNNGRLVKVRNGAVEYSFNLPDGASSIVADKTKSTLYFLANNQIYTKDLSNFGATPPSVFMKPNGAIALISLGYDNNNNLIYCGDALDAKQAGAVYILDPATKTEKKKLTVGAVPTGFIFQ